MALHALNTRKHLKSKSSDDFNRWSLEQKSSRIAPTLLNYNTDPKQKQSRQFVLIFIDFIEELIKDMQIEQLDKVKIWLDNSVKYYWLEEQYNFYKYNSAINPDFIGTFEEFLQKELVAWP